MQACINGATTMPYSLEQDLESAAAAGFPQVELWSRKLDPYLEHHTPADLRQAMASRGLKPAALCPYGIRFFGDWRQGLEAVRRGVGLAGEIGCPLLLVCPDAPQGADAQADPVGVAAERARAYGEVAAAAGVRLAIEPLGGHAFVPGPTQAMAILSAAGHPALGLMLDTFHYYRSGVSTAEVEAVPPGQWTIVHINDVSAGDRQSLRDRDRLYPGEGVLPLVDTLRHFRRIGFQGAVSVEVFRPSYWELPAAEIARRAHAGVTQVLRAAEVASD